MLRVAVLFACFALALGVGCKDQNNNDVDWFVAYKVPRTNDNSTPGVAEGKGLYYMDVSGTKLLPSPDIGQSNQAIAYTLQQYYSVKSDTSKFHVMYNDEPATSSFSENMNRPKFRFSNISNDAVQYGHNKGVVFFDSTSGFWLVHSIPKFPPADSYEYPASGTIYAQSILCMSFNYNQLAAIGTQLDYIHPDIYSSNLPTSMAAANPDLASVIGGSFKSGTPTSSFKTLTTKAGASFLSIAKTAEFNDDLYSKLVAPRLRASINVETWRRGSAVPEVCSATYVVYDVQEMQVGQTEKFTYTHDHSKIAISRSSSAPYVCIGDINRMTTQYVRGGGTVCLSNTKLWNVYSPLVLSTNTC